MLLKKLPTLQLLAVQSCKLPYKVSAACSCTQQCGDAGSLPTLTLLKTLLSTQWLGRRLLGH